MSSHCLVRLALSAPQVMHNPYFPACTATPRPLVSAPLRLSCLSLVGDFLYRPIILAWGRARHLEIAARRGERLAYSCAKPLSSRRIMNRQRIPRKCYVRHLLLESLPAYFQTAMARFSFARLQHTSSRPYRRVIRRLSSEPPPQYIVCLMHKTVHAPDKITVAAPSTWTPIASRLLSVRRCEAPPAASLAAD